MSIDYTSTALISSIKRKCMVPSSQLLFLDSDFVDMMSEELQSTIVPFMMGLREDNFVTYFDQTVSTTNNVYRIHPRAMGQKLRDAVLLDSKGNEINLPRLDIDQLKKQYSMIGGYSLYVGRVGYYFKDDSIFIYPSTIGISNFKLRQKYFRRPNNLTLQSSCGKITIIDIPTKTLTLDKIPTAFTASLTYDLIMGNPGFNSLGDDLVVSSVDQNAKTITFSATLPTDLSVGDWCCESGFSPIAQIPYEVQKLLVQRIAIVVMEELKDSEGLKNAVGIYMKMEESITKMLTPRSDGSPKKFNRSSYLFGGYVARWNVW